MGSYFPNGLPDEFLNFFLSHGQCAHCKSAINPDFTPCTCGLEEDPELILTLTFPESMYQSHYKVIENKEQTRLIKEKRYRLLKEAGGTHSEYEIDRLVDLQLQRCFYCATEFDVDKRGAFKFQKDHFLSVARGGDSSIKNIVLSCQKCNYSKNNQLADAFDRKIRKSLSPEQLVLKKQIRNEWRNWQRTLKKVR
jgi:5-methylcytosine-specific restriction endonuclease McrA